MRNMNKITRCTRTISERWLQTSTRASSTFTQRILPRDLTSEREFLKPNLDVNGKFASQSTVAQLAGSMKDISLINNGNKIQIVWKDGHISSFLGVWLRFNCHCSKCFDATSNMGRLVVSQMPTSFTIKSVDQLDPGKLKVTFEADGHESVFDSDWLRNNCYSKEVIMQRKKEVKPVFTDKNVVSKIPYSEIATPEGLYRWLKSISDNGLCLLTGVPTEHKYVMSVIEKIGPVMRNLYGEIYTVQVTQDPINVAYTNEALPFHMDLSQYESPPGIQFLHCLRFDKSISGGETIFVDMMQVAENFRIQHPDEFDILSKVPCPFQRIHASRDDPVEMVTTKPIIRLNNENEIIGITWHANLHGPLIVEEKYIEPFYKAYQLFAKAIENSPRKSVRFQPGDLIGYNNRRVAHGRNAFDDKSGGTRFLEGGYINIDDYRSKLAVLHRKYGDGTPLKRIGNNDYF